jgi:hypothetical protein
MFRSLTVIAALAGMTYTPAAAQMVRADRPETIVRYLQNEGYRAVLEEDKRGNPYISSGINGWNYDIYFLDCEDDGTCHSVKFLMGFDLPAGTTLEAANRYNYNRPLGSLSLDDQGDPWLEWVVSTRGGLMKNNFDDVLEWWATAVNWMEEDFPFSAEVEDESAKEDSDQ